MSYKFFQNKSCEYFPCHDKTDETKFNCIFCYCPLSYYKNCGGEYVILNNGWKDCTACLIPHYNYDYVINKLVELHDRHNYNERITPTPLADN